MQCDVDAIDAPRGVAARGEKMDDACAALTQWLCRSALPMWSSAGVDWHGGGFFEQLDEHARPVPADRRTRVVARQIYVFATAHRMGWMSGGEQVVEHGLRFLLGRLRRPDGLFASAVAPDGAMTRRDFDLYEHAFVLFALASAHRLRPATSEFAEIAAWLLGALRQWQHPVAGFDETRPRTLPLKSNPHMHLLEAALAWEDVAPVMSRAPWTGLADEIAALCLSRFIDPMSGAVREYFDGQWLPHPGQGHVIEPGHQFEWAWLLARWGRRRGRREAIQAAGRLVAIGERRGVDPVRDVAVNQLRSDLTVLDAAAKLWPQTERIKAWHAMAGLARGRQQTGRAVKAGARAADALMRYFRPSPAGLWHEELAPQGGFREGPSRASSLYHIVCAIESLQTPFVEQEP